MSSKVKDLTYKDIKRIKHTLHRLQSALDDSQLTREALELSLQIDIDIDKCRTHEEAHQKLREAYYAMIAVVKKQCFPDIT